MRPSSLIVRRAPSRRRGACMAPRAPARVTAARSGRAHVVRGGVMRPSSLIMRARHHHAGGGHVVARAERGEGGASRSTCGAERVRDEICVRTLGQGCAGARGRGAAGRNSPDVAARPAEVLGARERSPGVGVSPIGRQHINRRRRRRDFGCDHRASCSGRTRDRDRASEWLAKPSTATLSYA